MIAAAGLYLLLQASGLNVDLLSMPLVAAGLIIVFGLPHGAVDVMVAGMYRDLSDRGTLAVFLAQYVGAAVAVVLVWWLVPAVALVGFLLISAIHFGADWDDAHGSAGQATLGAALLSSTALLHQESVVAIFSWLVPHETASLVGRGLHICAPIALSAAALVLVRSMRRNWLAASEVAVTLASSVLLPPMTFFVAYFCFLHSVRHLYETRIALQDHSTQDLVREAAPYALAASVICVGGSAAFLHLAPGDALLSAVFVVLSALTVPHMLLMEFARTSGGPAIRLGTEAPATRT